MTDHRWRAALTAFAIVVVASVVALVTAVVVASSGGESRPAHGAVAPLDLSTVSQQVAHHYRYAEARQAEFRQIPCWCGCEQFLGHRNLADCFVRADGRGWEAHAAGCGVCIAEAAIAERMLGEGRTPAEVKVAVDERFGTTAITAPPLSRKGRDA